MQNCFVMPSRFKSHIILVLDRLQGVTRVNCLVKIKHSTCSHDEQVIRPKKLNQVNPFDPACNHIFHMVSVFVRLEYKV